MGVGGADWGLEEINKLKDRYKVDSLSDLFVPESPKDVEHFDACFNLPTREELDLTPVYGNVFGKHPEKQRQLIDDLLLQAQDVSSWAPTVLPPRC